MLTLLGRNSLLLYIWHYPIFVFVNLLTDVAYAKADPRVRYD